MNTPEDVQRKKHSVQCRYALLQYELLAAHQNYESRPVREKLEIEKLAYEVEQAKLDVALARIALEREQLELANAKRPSQTLFTTMQWDSEREMYECSIALEGEMDFKKVCAHGKTPDEASRNFDKLWFGKKG